MQKFCILFNCLKRPKIYCIQCRCRNSAQGKIRGKLLNFDYIGHAEILLPFLGKISQKYIEINQDSRTLHAVKSLKIIQKLDYIMSDYFPG